MRKEGLPIEGFRVAAGIASAEKAVKIIDGLRQAGIKHVAFNPKFPIILQWTGGRAGGHHSYEAYHLAKQFGQQLIDNAK
jgi:fatty acid synthase subunit alpha, fungi type